VVVFLIMAVTLSKMSCLASGLKASIISSTFSTFASSGLYSPPRTHLQRVKQNTHLKCFRSHGSTDEYPFPCLPHESNVVDPGSHDHYQLTIHPVSHPSMARDNGIEVLDAVGTLDPRHEESSERCSE